MAFYPKDNIHFGIELFNRMFTRIYNQMNTWNVRVGEQLSIVFSCFDKTIFNILNSLMAMYFILLVEIYAFKNRINKINISLITYITFFIIIISQPVIGQVFFWKTGSTNYLWALCLLLTFIMPLPFYIGTNSVDIIKNHKIKIFLFVIIGFFAGFTNENTVGAFWLLYLIVIIHNLFKKTKTPLWIYLTFFSYTLGFIFMLKAPSTQYRINFYNQLLGIDNITISDYLLRSIKIVLKFIYYNRLYLLILTSILVISIYINKRKHVLEWSIFFENIDLLIVAFISCGALVLSPYIEVRAFILADFILLVLSIYFLEFIGEQINSRNLLIKIGIFATIIPLTINIHNICQTYNAYYNYCEERESTILSSSEDNVTWKCNIIKNRILTNREDYLLGNEQYLTLYYNKTITIVNQ